MLNNAQSSFECFADQGLGSVCGSGIGDCGENASCQWEDYNYNQTVCIANEATGADCGAPGKGGCDAGNACVYVNPGSVILQCFEDQSAEDVCGYGIGLCESGSDCVFNAEGSDNATCQPQADAGDICGGYGQPNCGPFMGCLPENAEATSGICTTLSLAGDACGTPEGVCVGGTSCVYTDGTQTNAVCAVNGLIGATCGYGTVGWCWAGLTCAVEDAADVIGVCQDACELDGLYNNGTCDEGCWTLDPDCI